MYETFREQHDPHANYARLDNAVALEPPAEGTCPVARMYWVADTIIEMTKGLEAARMYTAFGSVYGSLSYNIADGMKNGEFDEPEALARQAIGFVDSWRRPVGGISRFLQGDDEALRGATEAWQMTYMDPRMEDAEPVTQFTAGMISHIVGDLALSLAEKQPPLSYYRDYRYKVGDKISDTTRQLAPELMPGHPLLRKVAIPVVVGGIALMREQAWRDFRTIDGLSAEAKQAKAQIFDQRATFLNNLLLHVDGPAMWAARKTEQFPDIPPAIGRAIGQIVDLAAYARKKTSEVFSGKSRTDKAA